MARTYLHTPHVVPEIFRQLVLKVSGNLSTDPDLSIAQVSYKFGSWIEVMDQLIKDNEDPTKRDIKYPLIVLLQQNRELYSDTAPDRFRGDILICTSTVKTMPIAERYTTNFEPILNPIFAELRQVIADSRFFLGYNYNFPFVKVELPHMGTASSNGATAYKLPDFLDGILMQDVDLKLNRLACNAACLAKYEIDVLSAIKTVSSAGLGTDTLSVTATAQNSNNAATYTWSIERQDGAQFNDLGSFNIGGANTLDLNTVSIQEGVYIVTITANNGAQAQIEVGVNVGYDEGETVPAQPVITVLGYVSESEALVYSIPCGLNPDMTYSYYPLVGSDETVMTRIEQYENGQQVYEEVLEEPELGNSLERSLIFPTTTIDTWVATNYGSNLKQTIIFTLKTT